jgi:dipeptidyl aminopeptidase/acylaminoacyl peptidase
LHGDADANVPIQQAESLIDKLRRVSVPAHLVIKPGAGHGWPDQMQDMHFLADWFDEQLKQAK